jgi:hypothetical protein
MKRGWIVKILKIKITIDKCIPLGIKDDNVPPKFVIQLKMQP